jgi:hypothetical protein
MQRQLIGAVDGDWWFIIGQQYSASLFYKISFLIFLFGSK